MVAILLTLLLAIQASTGNPLNPACCASKTVGDDAYTRVNTSVSFPGECSNACAYTKDSELGSLYCFARGDLPVHCTSEKPVDVSPCFPGPPGPTGCPPDNGLRITDDDPNTISSRPSSDDCWDYCRALCSGFQCYCYAWTYNTNDGRCYTFDLENACYDTIKEDGWVSGALCFETQTGATIETDTVPGHVIKSKNTKYGPYGGLPTANHQFSDSKFAGKGSHVSEIDIFTGFYGGLHDVIVGIRFYYNSLPTNIHGQEGKLKKCLLSKGSRFTGVTIRSINSGHAQRNLIYYLEFQGTSDNDTCAAGSQPGNQIEIPPSTGPSSGPQTLVYIKGYVTQSTTPMLGKLTFFFEPSK